MGEEDDGDGQEMSGERRGPQAAAASAVEPEEEGARGVPGEEEILGEVDVGGVAEEAGEGVEQPQPGMDELRAGRR
jgi:hypothetical protein